MKLVSALVSLLAAGAALAQAPAKPSTPSPPPPPAAPQAAAPAPAARGAPRKRVLVGNPGTSPFSRVVQAGDFVFVSGQLGFRPGSRELAAGGVGPETRAALEAIAANLAQAGLGMEDVVKCTVFLADVADFQVMNEAYAKFFPRDPPARTTVGASGLWGNARVEIDCMAMTR